MNKICLMLPGDLVSTRLISHGFLIQFDIDYDSMDLLSGTLERVNTEKKDSDLTTTLLCFCIVREMLARQVEKFSKTDISSINKLLVDIGSTVSLMMEQSPENQ